MIRYLATMAVTAAACPLWGYTLARLDERLDLSGRSERASWTVLVAVSLTVGAVVAGISAAVGALV